MATCDCEGSSRAYVVVKGGLIKRQEFLSLNPPVCVSIKKRGLSLDGITRIEPGGKEINSFNVSGGGAAIRVNWGGGDIEFLEGDTWSISVVNAAWFYLDNTRSGLVGCSNTVPARLDYQWRVLTGCSLAGRATTSTASPISTSPDVEIDWYLGVVQLGIDNFELINQRWSGQPIETERCFISCSSNTNRTVRISSIYNGFQVNRTVQTQGPCSSVAPATPPTVRARPWDGVWSVTTNTGATSSRAQELGPDVSASDSGCILSINYTNGTSLELNYGPNCPETAEVVEFLQISDLSGVLAEFPDRGQSVSFNCDSRQCPPETCCQIDCGGGGRCAVMARTVVSLSTLLSVGLNLFFI